MNTVDLTAAIHDARVRFNGGRRFPDGLVYMKLHRKCSLSFDELFELLRADCNTFSALGQLSNPPVTREAIRMIYRKYFKALLGRDGGHARRKVCTRKHVAVAVALPPKDPVVAEVAALVIQHGYPVRQIQQGKGYGAIRLLHHLLRINGHVVTVSTCTRLGPPPYKDHARFTTRLDPRADLAVFVDCVHQPHRYYVVPVAAIGRRPVLYARSTPFRYAAYRRRKPTVGISPYENAWHLLGSPTATSPQEDLSLSQ